MDKKKTINLWRLLSLCCVCLMPLLGLQAKDNNSGIEVVFSDKKYNLLPGSDTITVFFSIKEDGVRNKDVRLADLETYLTISEEDDSNERGMYSLVRSGRIPRDYTFSILVDLNLPDRAKREISGTIRELLNDAPENGVYLSTFGDSVANSIAINKENFEQVASTLLKRPMKGKSLYSALLTKILEFTPELQAIEGEARVCEGYDRNDEISARAVAAEDKNILFIFTESNKGVDGTDKIVFSDISNQNKIDGLVLPTVYLFYYTAGESKLDETTVNRFRSICTPRRGRDVIEKRRGKYYPANDMNAVLAEFGSVVQEKMYDYAYTYKVGELKTYAGNVKYKAAWGNSSNVVGEAIFSIGTAENSWPIREESAGDAILKYLMAILITLVTVGIFFCVIKIIIPFGRSKAFAAKYYKKYVPEDNVKRRICYYCRRDLQEGDMVVTKCDHIMHVHCWRQNGYKCAEYGQNCKTGIQEHVQWEQLFSKTTWRDCSQTISGVLAGFLSWVIYELCGRSGFKGIATAIVNTFYGPADAQHVLFNECVVKTSAFIMIGLLLGFFVSIIFRYNDEYRKKDGKIYLKIFLLSLLSSLIGVLAFVIGAGILCSILSVMNTTHIPWYCSLPAYLLFSVSVSLSLTIKSSIPVKSAVLGGLCSAVIGFIVLYFSAITSNRSAWANMLLDFIIYGGGLGASLVTVRMLAEKYFLVIQNGVRAGQRIPIHKWMNATGGGNKVTIGMIGDCEIQMNWEKSNKVAKEHAQLFIDHARMLPVIKPLAPGVVFNTRAELPVGNLCVLTNGDNFKIGDTIFQYVETE